MSINQNPTMAITELLRNKSSSLKIVIDVYLTNHMIFQTELFIASCGYFHLIDIISIFFSTNCRAGCSMSDLWDVEDPASKDRPPVCPVLFRLVPDPYPFRRVFVNDEYAVLQVAKSDPHKLEMKTSRYVELVSPPLKEYGQ
jgi:hypothetical protein